MSALLYFLIFVLGASVGSFVNVLVFRTRSGISLLWPRSQCPLCVAPIRFHDNLPVIGFLLLGGKCRSCHGHISRQYPLTEAALGIAFVATAYMNGVSFETVPSTLLRDWLIVANLAAIFLYDLRYGEIPDRFTLLPASLFFFASLGFGWQTWSGMLLGAGLGLAFFLFQFLLSRGRWIGGGDIRLGLFMGVILGWPGILIGLFVSYLIGAFVSIFLLALRKKRFGDAIPFGTFLAVGTIWAMFWGQEIFSWYMNLLQ